MAGEGAKWWPLKLQLLEANYEKCKLKIRQDSLYCKLFIIQLQNAFDEERFITQKYEKKVVTERLQQAEQQIANLAQEKEFVAKKAVEDLSSVEGEWKAKADELVKKIESLQIDKLGKETCQLDVFTSSCDFLIKHFKEEKENAIKSKELIILGITKELETLRSDRKQSKDTPVTKNGQEQLGRRRKLGQSNEPRAMHDSNCKGTVSNHIQAQNSNNIVLQKVKNVPEGSKGNFSGHSEGNNLVLDNSEKLASISAEKLLESELGSILEVTEEMLKSCRRRSVLKRKKSGFSDHLHDDNETDTDEVSGCTKKDKKRKERRVTFSDELEIKLPDGSREVVEMESLNESFEQTEIIDKQNVIEEDLPVFDDILSREMRAGEEEPNSENKEVDDVDGKDGEKIATEKTKSLQEKNDNEEKKELQSFESGGNEESYENKDVPGSCVNENLAKESKKKGVRRKAQKGRKMASEQKSKQKNREIIADAEERGKEENDEGNRNMLPVEADILLSPDCHFQEVQLPSRDEDVSQDNNNTKTIILKDKTQLNSSSGNADDLCNSKIQKTGGRLQNITPRRGLGQQTNSDDNAKPSRRLTNVFDDEPELNEVPKEDIQYEEGEKQARRNTKGNKKKSTNRSVSKSKSVDASNMKIVEDVEKDRVQNLEKEQAEHIKDETASDNVSKIVRKKKVQNKKASRKTRKVRNSLIKIEQEDEKLENKQRGKRKRGKTIKQARKLSFVRDVAGNIKKNAGEIKDNAENDDISKNCSPQQVSLLPNEVKSTGKRKRRKKIIYSDDAEERNMVDKHYEEEGEKKLVFEKKNGKIKRWKTTAKVDNADDVVETRKGEGNEDEIQRTNNEENVKRRDARIKVNNYDHDEFGEERDEVDDNKDLKKRKTRKRPFESDDEEMNVTREEPPESKNLEGACAVDSIEDEREEHNIEETVKPEFITEVTGKEDGEVDPTLKKTLNEDCKDQVKDTENKNDENRKRKKTKELDSSNHSNKTVKVDVEGAVDTNQDNFDENKSMTDDLILKKRKSPEHETDVQDEQYDNEMQELNAKKADDVEIDGEDGKAISDEKVGQAIESDKTDTKIGKSFDIRKRRANLRSKRKLHEPEIEQHDNKIQDLGEREEEVRVEGDVELENNEADKGSDEHTKDELKEKTEKRKNTKVSERKSDSTVVNFAKKIKSKKGKKIEAVIDSSTTSEGIAVDMQGENGSDENRMKSGKEDDKDKENCERETIKRGRKRGLAEMKDDNIQEKNENDIEEKQMEIKVEEKVDDKHMENRGRKISTRRRKHDVAQMREVGIKTEDKEKEVKNELVEIVDDEDKENGGEKTNKTGRESGQENKIDETEKNGNEEGKRSKKGRAVRKSNVDETANKNEVQIPVTMNKKAREDKKKRRTLYSNRDSSTFINTTSSIFQETLSMNHTRSSTGMPPPLSAFMQAFIVPKLKKK